jgi:magnesium chelatase subunit H
MAFLPLQAPVTVCAVGHEPRVLRVTGPWCEAHRAKLQRDRVETELAAAKAELNVARRGGGAAAAVAAAVAAAATSAAAAATAAADDFGALPPPPPRRIVLISGFESFNVKLYRKAAKSLARRCPWVELVVFSDRDIEAGRWACGHPRDG